MQEPKKRRTVLLYSFASFLNDMGADMISPIWPLFVTTVLGANMAILGFLDGLGEAFVSISQAVGGYVSDRIKKRKFFIWFGYFCAGIARLGYALSTVWQHLIPVKILDRAGKLRDAPRDAIIADVSTSQNRGRNFGLLNAMDSMGAIFGILITFFFFEILGYTKTFLLAAIPSLLGVLLIMSFAKETKLEHIKLYKGVSFKDFDKNFILFLILSAIFALGSFSYSFLLIFAKEFGFQITFIPVLYLIFTATTSLSDIIFGNLSDKIGRKKVLLLAFIFWGLVCASFIFLKSYWTIILTFAVYGLHKGARETMQKTFVSELAAEEFRASTLGAYQMVIGLCALPASAIAGALWYKFGAYAPFSFSLALTIIATTLLFFVRTSGK